MKSFVVSFLGIFFLINLGCEKDPSHFDPEASLDDTFQALLNRVLDNNHNAKGISLHIFSEKYNINFSGAVGVSDIETDSTLDANQPFRIASVTKPFTATAILRLMENGQLQLDDPISQYISTKHLNILKEKYDPSKITIRHCLNHTSGLFDYALDGMNYIDTIIKQPQHRWTRTEQLEVALKWGDPHGEPGQVYRYSDTGYILLGEIIEKITGQSLAQAMRELIGYERLGMQSTWLETLEPEPPNLPDRIHQYFRGRIDVYDFDPSSDLYGGGGLVSTTSDLTKFADALFSQKIFDDPSTLQTMLTKTIFPKGYELTEEKIQQDWSGRDAADYRLGLMVPIIFGDEVYIHGGFWGTQMIYLPKYKTAVAYNFTRGGGRWFLLKRIILILEKLDQHQRNKN